MMRSEEKKFRIYHQAQAVLSSNLLSKTLEIKTDETITLLIFARL